MRTLIEEYRKFEIYFDTDKEVFYTVSDSWDKESSNKSFAAIKRWIDNFIKDNSEFKPFFVEKFNSIYEDGAKIRVVGIRKDGRFVYDNEGKNEQISEYDESKWCLINTDNEPIKEELKLLREEEKKIGQKIRQTEQKLIKVSLKDIKSNYITE